MSSSHHDEHQHDEKKPVAFTVPFILAAVTVLIILMFLSLCDPKAGHHGKGSCHECTESGSKECTHHGDGSEAIVHGENQDMLCDACKSGCSKECMDACVKGDHSKHPEMLSEEKHKMNCGECKSDCSQACMDSCMKGDHSKHSASAIPADSIKSNEAVHTH